MHDTNFGTMPNLGSRHSLPVSGLVLATLATWSLPAFAQQSPPQPGAVSEPTEVQPPIAPVDPARVAYDRGVEALSGNRFEEAVPALEESYRLRPLAIVMYNLGLAYRGMHRSAAAITAFETFIDTREADVDAARLQAVRDEITRLRAMVATLVVSVNAAGASLRVDGRTRNLAASGVLLDAGTHTVELSAAGYLARGEEVTVHPGQRRTLEVQLDRALCQSNAAEPSASAPRSAPAGSLSPLVPVGAGIGVLAGGIATGLWLSGNVAFDSYRATCANSTSPECERQYQDLSSTRPAIVNTMWVVAGLGLATAVIGVVMSYAQRSDSGRLSEPAERRALTRSRAHARLLVAPTSAGLLVTW